VRVRRENLFDRCTQPLRMVMVMVMVMTAVSVRHR
jgi:hypothetical protein